MADGYKTGGRTKGTPNKLTRAVKEVLVEAADELGGKDRLVAWAKEDPSNERLFWGSIYPKLLGATGTADDPIHTQNQHSGLGPIYGKNDVHPPAEA